MLPSWRVQHQAHTIELVTEFSKNQIGQSKGHGQRVQPTGRTPSDVTSLGMCSKSAPGTPGVNPHHLRLSAKGAAEGAHLHVVQVIGIRIPSTNCQVYIAKLSTKARAESSPIAGPLGYIVLGAASSAHQPEHNTEPDKERKPMPYGCCQTGRTPAVATPGWKQPARRN